MALDVHVIIAPWDQHKQVLRSIREAVFIVEQEVPRELEWDDEDETATHFLAVNTLGQFIGCARLLETGQIGRMAVLESYRGKGIGKVLLEAAVAAGKEAGFERLFLHAQTYAEAFYRQGGFLPYGEKFTEADIEHIAMEMKLPLAFQPPEGLPAKESTPKPDRSSAEPLRSASQADFFEGYSDSLEALSRIIESARRRLLILSPYLDHELFDQEHIAQAVSALARSAPRVEIEILIYNSQLIVERGHRLLELARRLDQKITIRLLAETPTAASSSFVCADLDAYWLLPSFEKHQGIADLNNPVTTRRLSETFAEAWRKSREDPDLRLLRI
ncbi:MAG: GNAT family N-acetyltransferase [Pseudomonadaceae bacterium]|nr:GNAT family N-acetyltransferase [Pseudomonadaceae bacterium]